jgi:hypothetical protein
VVLSVEVLPVDDPVGTFALDVRYFAVHSCYEALLVLGW